MMEEEDIGDKVDMNQKLNEKIEEINSHSQHHDHHGHTHG